MDQYQRHELTAEERQRIIQTAHQLTRLLDYRRRHNLICELLSENIRLTYEVLEHRAARGFEPLATYEIKMKGGNK